MIKLPFENSRGGEGRKCCQVTLQLPPPLPLLKSLTQKDLRGYTVIPLISPWRRALNLQKVVVKI